MNKFEDIKIDGNGELTKKEKESLNKLVNTDTFKKIDLNNLKKVWDSLKKEKENYIKNNSEDVKIKALFDKALQKIENVLNDKWENKENSKETLKVVEWELNEKNIKEYMTEEGTILINSKWDRFLLTDSKDILKLRWLWSYTRICK